ncbi:Txe/YoeB family addiction module toxin [Antribacter gilvus]|uniref:Txe/YoeB family addiction module toxin n=1 Tax=Antribacter gilvus TaxID=2304675 RepID=UPI000F76DFD7|nr:Txe/YoeB family addiction module toxin [Antribacter gilvus]
MIVAFTPGALEEYRGWASDRAGLRRVNRIIDDAARDPEAGIGKPERLRGDWSGYWSRRITQEHRLVYTVTRLPDGVEVLLIVGCAGHYS